MNFHGQSVPTELLAVGSELTVGLRQDTNTLWLRRELQALHVRVVRVTSLPDQVRVIADEIGAACSRSSLVILTGGLGPTEDDRTLEALAAGLGRRRRVHPQARAWLEAALPGRRRDVGQALLRQVRLPVGARPLRNRRGTAPGLLLETGRSLLVALPGVPDEMRGLWRDEVLPELATRLPAAARTRRRMVVGGLRESEVDGRVAPVCLRLGVELTILAGGGVVELHLEGEEKAMGSALQELRILLADDLVSSTGASLEETVLAAARSRGGDLAVAESCTGGRVAARLTSVPGASDVFLGSLVVYSDDMKRRFLGVPEAVLRQHGAVSGQTARAMVEGLRRRTGCRWGVAVTGIAGPHGSRRGKPVGSVWFAAAGPEGVVSSRCRLPGGRERVQDDAAGMALDLLRRSVLSGRSEA